MQKKKSRIQNRGHTHTHAHIRTHVRERSSTAHLGQQHSTAAPAPAAIASAGQFFRVNSAPPYQMSARRRWQRCPAGWLAAHALYTSGSGAAHVMKYYNYGTLFQVTPCTAPPPPYYSFPRGTLPPQEMSTGFNPSRPPSTRRTLAVTGRPRLTSSKGKL